VEILCGSFQLLSIWPKTSRIIDFRKNDFSRSAMLAKHSYNHSQVKVN